MLVACYPILIHFAFRRNLDVRSDGLQAKIHPPGNWWRVCSFGIVLLCVWLLGLELDAELIAMSRQQRSCHVHISSRHQSPFAKS